MHFDDPFAPEILSRNNTLYVYSLLRKKKLLLTPEEWVRQRTVRYLLQKLKYPKELIAEEKKIENSMLRFDLLVYNRSLLPFLIIETKAPYVSLSEQVVLQAHGYARRLDVPFFSVTNGKEVLVYDTRKQIFLTEFPEYE